MPCAIGIVLYLVSIASLFRLNSRTDHNLTPCLFKNATGAPCFLCGGTRSSLALAQGDVISAFLFNPMVCVMLILSATLILLKVVAGIRLRITPVPRRWLWLLAIAVVAANWAYLINRL